MWLVVWKMLWHAKSTCMMGKTEKILFRWLQNWNDAKMHWSLWMVRSTLADNMMSINIIWKCQKHNEDTSGTVNRIEWKKATANRTFRHRHLHKNDTFCCCYSPVIFFSLSVGGMLRYELGKQNLIWPNRGQGTHFPHFTLNKIDLMKQIPICCRWWCCGCCSCVVDDGDDFVMLKHWLASFWKTMPVTVARSL